MRFYVLDRRKRFEDTLFAYGEEVDMVTGDFQRCSKCGVAISDRKWLPPYKVKLSKPIFGDFVFGTFSTMLTSFRFRDEYIQSRMKGIIDFEKVDVVKIIRARKVTLDLPVYFKTDIVHGCARIDEAASHIVWDNDSEGICDTCRSGAIKSLRGIHIVESTWSGEDIFFPVGLPGTIITSQRFYDFVTKNEFTNVSLVPAEEYIPTWAGG